MDLSDGIVKNYKFWVFIGPLKMSFSKVSGFENSIGVEEYMEGGLNTGPVLFEQPEKSRHTVTFERGVYAYSGAFSQAAAGLRIPGGITVISFSDLGIPIMEYFIADPIITKWKVDSFDAENGRVLVEEFEVAYTKLDMSSLV